MASLHQKRPSISNWFSSLRRQPKNNKKNLSSSNSIYGGGGNEKYQRSCIDLSSAVQHHQQSTFYVPPEISKSKASFQTTAPASRIGSTDTILQENYDSDCSDRRGLVNGSGSGSAGQRVSQLCSRCCCYISGAASRAQTPSSKSSPKSSSRSVKSPPLPRSPSIAPYNTIATYNMVTPSASPSPPQSPLSPQPVTLSSETVITTDVSRDIITFKDTLPCASESEIEIFTHNKRSEFKKRMTTKTTRTVVVSRPVELVLNENGEIISRRPPHLAQMKARSNSFDCVLDGGISDNDHHDDDHDDVVKSEVGVLSAGPDGDGYGDDNCDCNSNCTSSYSPCSPTPHSVASTIFSTDGDEFRFIDDSSTSHSETERNSHNSNSNSTTHGRRLTDDEPVILRTTKRSHNYTNNNNNNNKHDMQQQNNNNIEHPNSPANLCDACKRVLEMNRTNAAQSADGSINKQIKDELSEVLTEMEALDVPEDCKHSNKDKQMSIGRKKFNMDPKKGIEYLVENRLLRHDPQDVAHFLYKGEGLNKTAIGDYLGEKNDFNEDVLKSFVALHDFTNLILVQALRQFLWSFRLPGEAQKIDRMMECFAQRYCQLNPDIFTNTDTCYVLSFAIIMLNTSLHNPSVKDKPTVEQFITMNRGINNGGDLPRELLESLYESIRTEPFKIPQDDGNDLMHTFFNPDKEGWLWKQGGRYKSWKRRWFILNDNCLYYFEYTTDKEPRGIIPLENISVREIHDRSKPHCFELFATGGADIIKACKTDSEGKVVEGKHSVYRMSAATEEDQQEWMKRLTQSISHNPFYDILVQRKKKALSKS